MKYPILMLLLINICASCTKEPQISTRQTEEFIKFFGTAGIDTSGQVLLAEDGYLMSANEAYGNESRACIYKTDFNGNVQFKSTISDTLNMTVRSFIPVQGGGYFACGYMIDSVQKLFVAKIDSDNALQWISYYASTYGQYGSSMLQDPSGNLYIAGTRSTDKAGKAIFLMKYSASGDTLWTKELYGGIAGGIAQGTDGTIYIVGSTSNKLVHTQDKSNILLLVTNPSGGLLHSITYGGMGNDYGYSVCVDDSGAVIITGAVESANNDTDGWIACITGNVYAPAWTATAGRGRDDAFFASAVSGKELYVSGYSKNEQNGNKELYIAKYSTDGILLNEYISGGEGEETATSVSFAPDGQPIATGSSQYESNAVLFMLKTKF